MINHKVCRMSPQADKKKSERQYRSYQSCAQIVIATCIAMSTAFAQELEPPADPTQPPAVIAERMRQAPLVQTATAATTLAPLPKLRLKSIVLRDASHGSAWISHEDELVKVELLQEEAASIDAVRVPKSQFKSQPPASSLNPLSTEAENDSGNFDIMDLRNAVQFGDRWFQVVTFSQNAIVMRVLPDGRLVIVR